MGKYWWHGVEVLKLTQKCFGQHSYTKNDFLLPASKDHKVLPRVRARPILYAVHFPVWTDVVNVDILTG